jgi:hypothetical protein
MTLEYHLAELIQRGPSADREPVLQKALEQYEKFLTRLDEYELLSKEDRKLFETYMANPSAFTLAPVNDAATRRDTKVRRFREEKELKQKLEVGHFNCRRIIHFLDELLTRCSIWPETKHDSKATATRPGSSTYPSFNSIHTKPSRH